MFRFESKVTLKFSFVEPVLLFRATTRNFSYFDRILFFHFIFYHIYLLLCKDSRLYSLRIYFFSVQVVSSFVELLSSLK